MHLIEDHAERRHPLQRFAASKLAEGDRLVLEQLNLSENEKEMLEHIIVQMEQERGLDRAAIAGYAFLLHRKGLQRNRRAPAREPRARPQRQG